MQRSIADVLHNTLRSPNVADSNSEPANLVDTTDDIAKALHRIADALTSEEFCGGGCTTDVSLAKALSSVAGAIELMGNNVSGALYEIKNQMLVARR